MLEGESSCKIRMIDTDTGASREAYSVQGTVQKIGLKDSSYTHRYNGAAAKFDDEYAYFQIRFSRNEDSGRFRTEYFNECCKISLENGTMTEISKDEFESAADLSADTTGEWTYGSDGDKVYRTNTQSGITETLLSGNNDYYITNDSEWVIVLKAETLGTVTPTSTDSYESAQIYVMDTDGNNLRLINSYSNSLNASSPVGEINSETLAPEVCAICGGSGMVTCSFCRGTGQGQSISIMGMETQQGCTYCGSSGKRVCNGCGGSGQK